jgi:hypothetical protein
MKLEPKELKGTYRYKYIDFRKAPIIDYLYIKKYAFPGNPPDEIEVEIKATKR